MSIHPIRIHEDRFLADLAELRRIGATPEGGVNRPSFSDAHLQARAWFREKAQAAGLEFQVDAAGNHSAALPGSAPQARTLLIGSHLDSVYNGGGYDGALGVMAGLEMLRTIHDAGLALPCRLEVIDFTDEEGTLFGMLGSKALTGAFRPEMLEHGVAPRETIVQALQRGGVNPDRIFEARRDAQALLGYLELHIEQGPRLDRAALQVGVVTGIVGMNVIRVVYRGTANHAGTTAMDQRRDAGLAASALHLAAYEAVTTRYPECVVTVGQMQFRPGGVNIVPAEAAMSVDFRSVEEEPLARLEEEILRLAHRQAERGGVEVVLQKAISHEPARMDARFQDTIEAAARDLGLSSARIPSGAGHDAQNMAAVCPSGMIFVPSRGGISHSPMEHTTEQDCLNGANVLLQSALELAQAEV